MAGTNGPPPMVSQATSNNPPWSSTISIGSLFVSCIILATSYYRLSPRYATTKQSAWILTTISSAIMTIASLPFLYDYFSNGGSVKHIRTVPNLSIAVNRFFQSYLVIDLALGSVHYSSHVSLLTGWIHHSVYIVIVEIAIRRSWSHIFCLCATMEVPTFFLGFMTLYPELRSNIAFAVAFFLTRILFHIILGISYFLHDNRTHATGGSYLPSFLLATIFPLHAMWFYGCIKGFVRRASRAHHRTRVSSTTDITPVADRSVKVSPMSEPQNKRSAPSSLRVTTTNDRYYNTARSIDATPSSSPTFSTHDLKLVERRSKLRSRRIYSRSMSLNSNDSRSSVTGTLTTKLYASLPNREVVFDYVGLGQGSVQEQ